METEGREKGTVDKGQGEGKGQRKRVTGREQGEGATSKGQERRELGTGNREGDSSQQGGEKGIARGRGLDGAHVAGDGVGALARRGTRAVQV